LVIKNKFTSQVAYHFPQFSRGGNRHIVPTLNLPLLVRWGGK